MTLEQWIEEKTWMTEAGVAAIYPEDIRIFMADKVVVSRELAETLYFSLYGDKAKGQQQALQSTILCEHCESELRAALSRQEHTGEGR